MVTTSNTERKEYAEGGAADGQGTSRLDSESVDTAEKEEKEMDI